jgi:hypothetical protein
MSRGIEWAAGLFEGEGCIMFTNKNSVRLNVDMTDEDVVREFASTIGCGRVESIGVRPGCKPAYRWRISKKSEVLTVLGWLMPFLGQRRHAKAEQAILRLVKNGSKR